MRSLNNYILDDIFVLFYVSDLHIEAFYRVRKYDTVRKFPGYGKFLGYVLNNVEIQDINS